MHNIGCVILTNTDDLKFLRAGIKQISSIFKHIVISMGTKLWNGGDENEEARLNFKEEIQSMYSNVSFVIYNVPEDKQVSFINNGMVSKDMYWEGHARYISLEQKEIQNCSYVVFLDSDEIVDGEKFKRWLDTEKYKSYDAMKLRNFWYWREPIYRARGYYEDSVVMIKQGTYDPRYIFSNMGRHGVFDNCTGRKARDVGGEDGTPMIHHYSWVRNHDEMRRKVLSWGHRNDRMDWLRMVDEEFSRNFNGTDFLKRLNYDVVNNRFGIKMF